MSWEQATRELIYEQIYKASLEKDGVDILYPASDEWLLVIRKKDLRLIRGYKDAKRNPEQIELNVYNALCPDCNRKSLYFYDEIMICGKCKSVLDDKKIKWEHVKQ